MLSRQSQDPRESSMLSPLNKDTGLTPVVFTLRVSSGLKRWWIFYDELASALDARTHWSRHRGLMMLGKRETSL